MKAVGLGFMKFNATTFAIAAVVINAVLIAFIIKQQRTINEYNDVNYRLHVKLQDALYGLGRDHSQDAE